MSSSTLVEPAYRTGPSYSRTLGPEVSDLGRLVGAGPDPEQEFLLDDLFATDATGRAASFEFAVIACRQNIKTHTFKLAALGWLFITDQRLIVWSAHEFRTAQSAFRDMTELIEGCHWLDRRVKRIYRGSGAEAIELLSGQQLIFKARTRGGGRGLTGDKVVLDEAFALQGVHMGALLPTLSARPDPQVVYGSSAGLGDSAVLRGIRDRGRANTSPRLSYTEWGVDRGGCEFDDCAHGVTATGCVLDDETRWHRANPALGGRINVETVRSERQAMPPDEFARGRLGWWDEPAAEQQVALDLVAWAALRSDAAVQPERVTLAVDVSPDRRRACIGVAAEYGEKTLLLVRPGAGTAWVVPELVRLVAKGGVAEVALRSNSQAGALIPDLVRAGVEFVDVATAEMGQGCAAFQSGVLEGRFVHVGQPELDAAVAAAKTRRVGEAELWDRKDLTDISPLVAVSVAAYRLAKTDLYDPMDSIG